jgi:hypothetical protein
MPPSSLCSQPIRDAPAHAPAPAPAPAPRIPVSTSSQRRSGATSARPAPPQQDSSSCATTCSTVSRTPKEPGGVGYVRDFVKIDSNVAEDLRPQAENNLPRAIDVAINQSILSDPTLVSVLRDAIALHHVRNPQTLEIHEQAFADAFQKVADVMARTPLPRRCFTAGTAWSRPGPRDAG